MMLFKIISTLLSLFAIMCMYLGTVFIMWLGYYAGNFPIIVFGYTVNIVMIVAASYVIYKA